MRYKSRTFNRLEVRKDTADIGRLGLFGLAEDDAIIATEADLTQAGSDRIRFEFDPAP